MLENEPALEVERAMETEDDLRQFTEALEHAHPLHFAGHGFYNAGDPRASGLVFRGRIHFRA